MEFAILDKPLRRLAVFISMILDSARRRRIDWEICESSRKAPTRYTCEARMRRVHKLVSSIEREAGRDYDKGDDEDTDDVTTTT